MLLFTEAEKTFGGKQANNAVKAWQAATHKDGFDITADGKFGLKSWKTLLGV